jgi:DNA ligase-3
LVRAEGFHGDKVLWVKLLLPAVEKRVYNLKRRQLTKLFAHMLGANYEKMLEAVETSGDVAQTIGSHFARSTKLPPSSKSELTLQEVDAALEELSMKTKEDDQEAVLEKITAKYVAV